MGLVGKDNEFVWCVDVASDLVGGCRVGKRGLLFSAYGDAIRASGMEIASAWRVYGAWNVSSQNLALGAFGRIGCGDCTE